jgi:hypothetical protein
MEILFNVKRHRWFNEKQKGFVLECGKFVFYDIAILLRPKPMTLNSCGNFYLKSNKLTLRIKYNDIFLSFLFLELAKNKKVHISNHDDSMMGVCEAELKIAESNYYYFNIL